VLNAAQLSEDFYMKKLSFAAAMIALASTACGSDGDKKDADKDVDAGGVVIPEDASAGDPGDFPECPRDLVEAYPDFTGTAPWNEAQLEACQMKCGSDETCFTEENCTGFDMFNECFNGTLISCLTVDKGVCRVEWEDYNCCADAFKCAAAANTTQEQYDACIEKNCASTLDDVGTCLRDGPDTIAGMPCSDAAITTCLAPNEEMMTMQNPASAARTAFGERQIRALLGAAKLRAN
jgi:hypothetical protein